MVLGEGKPRERERERKRAVNVAITESIENQKKIQKP